MRDNRQINSIDLTYFLWQFIMINDKKKPFESQLEALEQIVDSLESGDLSLNDSLSQFEKGVKLTKDCQNMLNQAEQKVMLLSENSEELETFSKE